MKNNLILLNNLLDELIINLRYQSFDNVFGEVLYQPDFEARLHKEAFKCFEQAIKIARAEFVI